MREQSIRSAVVFLIGLGHLFTAVGLPVPAWAGAVAWKDWVVVFEEHTDLSTGYDPVEDEWTMTVDRGAFNVPGETGEILTPDRTILHLTEASKRTLESDPPPTLSFLGQAGDSYYRVITTELEGVVFLGFNGYGVGQGVFQGPSGGEFFIELSDFDGAGDFFLYTGGPNNLDLLMDSTSAEPPYGTKREFAGGHSHQNWIFRDPGIYLLWFRPHGVLTSGEETSGQPHPFYFLVDPAPIDWWIVSHFREEAREPHAALTADISGDGHPNLLAYALGYPPAENAAPYLPQPEIVSNGEESFLSLVVRRPEGEAERDDRSDLLYEVQVSEDLVSWQPLNGTWESVEPDHDGVPRYRVTDPEPISSETPRRFIRLHVEFLPRE